MTVIEEFYIQFYYNLSHTEKKTKTNKQNPQDTKHRSAQHANNVYFPDAKWSLGLQQWWVIRILHTALQIPHLQGSKNTAVANICAIWNN